MSKRTDAGAKLVDNLKKYTLPEAAALVKKGATAKFDETVEIHVHMGVDPKKSDQNVRGTVSLPHGIGKSKKVIVIAKGEKIKEAQGAGADEAGDADNPDPGVGSCKHRPKAGEQEYAKLHSKEEREARANVAQLSQALTQRVSRAPRP